MSDEIRSGLIHEVSDIETRVLSMSGDVNDSASPGADRKSGDQDASDHDSDGSDGADTDGTDGADTDGSDGADADGTDSADADGTDNA